MRLMSEAGPIDQPMRRPVARILENEEIFTVVSPPPRAKSDGGGGPSNQSSP
jgi:hypothetical protein